MADITLGKTQITVNKNGFGCLPVQRVSVEEAVRLLRKARENGINFFDTARAYTDSEEKLGEAFGGSWDGIFLATKTASKTPEGFWKDLETSLSKLKRDYVDIYQFHNPDFCPKPGDGSGLYECMLEAKAQGKIRHIGITNHRLSVAHEAIDSGLYETLQFPFSYLSGEKELELVEKCRAADMGCEIGSHSYRHANLGKMDQAAQQADQAAADALFQEVLGTTPALLRPPYGSMNKTLKTTSGRSIVTWSIDTEDWRSKDADKVVTGVENAGNLDGQVILLHSIYESTVAATEVLVPWLLEQGYQLVTVSELIQLRFGDQVEPNRTYNYDYFRFQVPPLPAETAPAAA